MLITIKFMRVMESKPIKNFKGGGGAPGAGSAFADGTCKYMAFSM